MRVIKSNQSLQGRYTQGQQRFCSNVTTTSIGRTIDFETRIAPDRYVCSCISEK